MRLVERKDLQLGKKGFGAKLLSHVLMRVLKIDEINRIYEQGAKATDGRNARMAMDYMKSSYSVCDYDISNIPATGAAIIICNHPTGAMDGVMLIDLLSKIRPDIKFMGNFLLNRIDYLNKYFIAVDPFDSKDQKKNVQGIRQSLRHLEQGGALVIFPAGEVATYYKGWRHVRDKKWEDSIIKFIRKAEVPVIPICIEGRNSRMFHVMGKIHPMLRTAMLPREFINKKGKTIDISIGSAIMPKKVAELDFEHYGNYLRANVEYLRKKRRRKIRIIPKRKPTEVIAEDVIAAIPIETLRAELNVLKQNKAMLFEYSTYEVYLAPPQLIPNMMIEIGRLREITFREIGEGTMKGYDTDHYDTYYRQLFIWDTATDLLVGAYRMGMGNEIIRDHGLKGFYTYSLFKMDQQMAPIMAKTIELGRSFIVKEYQRKPASLMLLWKGIVYVLLKHEEYRNLLGPVTISGDFDKVSKTLIMHYLRKNHMDEELSKFVHPVTGLDGIDAPIDDSLIDGILSIDMINKIVVDIERNEMSIPILIRKYLQVHSHVLAFNVDHDFCDALDALMLLDLKRMPEDTIAMLSKEVVGIDVVARFQHIS